MNSATRQPHGHGSWQMWAVFTQGGERVKERHLSNHWFKWSARDAARRLNGSPDILARSIESLTEGGRGIFVDCEVRREGKVVWSDAEANE